jgi:formate-dependent nitrite reductase membrane component NrfD
MAEELVWGIPVIGYLFLAGVGAGAVTVSASVLLRGGGGGFGGRHFAIARYGALIGPIPVILGTTMIVFELGRPFRMLNLLKVINLSPMNVGSWLLLLFIGISLLYGLTFLPWPAGLQDRLRPARRALAWICVPLGIGVAVYTGVMLGAMPSRPFWNSPILALLFLISSLSTGIATILLAQALIYRAPPGDPDSLKQFHQSGYLLTASDILLIGLELPVHHVRPPDHRQHQVRGVGDPAGRRHGDDVLALGGVDRPLDPGPGRAVLRGSQAALPPGLRGAAGRRDRHADRRADRRVHAALRGRGRRSNHRPRGTLGQRGAGHG